jgi:hypothetical protein
VITLLLSAALVLQAAPVKNPTVIQFDCPDHAQDTEHELDVIDSAGVVISTLLLGDPPAVSGSTVEATISVQPVKFGSYRFAVRAVASGVKSVNSAPSDLWERVPGQPGKVVVK